MRRHDASPREGRPGAVKRVTRIARPVAFYLAVGTIGFIIGGFSLYAHLVRSGPPLELWHAEELEGEYGGRTAGGVKRFEDYL